MFRDTECYANASFELFSQCFEFFQNLISPFAKIIRPVSYYLDIRVVLTVLGWYENIECYCGRQDPNFYEDSWENPGVE